MKAAWICLVATLSACSPPSNEAPPAPEKRTAETVAERPSRAREPVQRVRVETPLILASDGLLLADPAGKLQLLPFGTPRIKAESAVGVIVGTPMTRGSSDECSAGIVDYTELRGGLQMTFQDDKFVGWTINGAASPFKTAKGIGIGSPRQSLDAGYGDATAEESSLGLLFSGGGFVGILDQEGIEGIVTDIWAGTVCLID
jgi:hypothetical protein